MGISLDGLGGLGLLSSNKNGAVEGLGGYQPSILGSLADYPPSSPPRNGLFFGFADSIGLSPPSPLSSAFDAFIAPPPPPVTRTQAIANALIAPTIKRKAYFAFRFEDIMRVNNVRNAWKIDHPDSQYARSFYDRSIWGKSDAQEPESLKALMRNAVVQSSAICVLVATNTWKGRWVKYEIARSVIDGRGLVAVHINGLNHIKRKAPDANGYNPLECMGIYHAANGCYYLFENFVEVNPQTGHLGWAWRQYEDYKDAVSLPRYIPSITQGYVMPLSRYTSEYDYLTGNGDRNIGGWVDAAAAAVGR